MTKKIKERDIERESQTLEEIEKHIHRVFEENHLSYEEVLFILEAIKFDMMLSLWCEEDD